MVSGQFWPQDMMVWSKASINQPLKISELESVLKIHHQCTPHDISVVPTSRNSTVQRSALPLVYLDHILRSLEKCQISEVKVKPVFHVNLRVYLTDLLYF